jgi:hypothetical protein
MQLSKWELHNKYSGILFAMKHFNNETWISFQKHYNINYLFSLIIIYLQRKKQ